MFRSHPLFARFFVFAVLPLAILLGTVFLHFRSSVPEISGISRIDGLDGQLSISRDAHGVAYISAKTDRDVYFAMGYAHAQDRLWQLYLYRRIARGGLSEIFGREMLQQDILFRTLDLYGAAERSWSALSPEAQSSLLAYASGINTWLKSNKNLPPEFALLNVVPEQWQPADSLAVMKIFAFNLSGNMVQELERVAARRVLDPVRMQALFPGYPAGAPLTIADANEGGKLTPLLSLQRQVEQQLQLGGRFVGSNAWAVAGRWTEDGSPLLANDPHMSLPMPSLWYAVSQSGDKLESKGMSLIGLPLVIFGANGHIAWGGTNMMADAQDIYVEQIDAADPGRYRRSDGAWAPIASHDTLIPVKAEFPAQLRAAPEPVKVRIRKTENGPLISDAVGVLDYPAALRWTALDDDDTSYEAFYRLAYADDWPKFRQALARHVAPALNMLYADKAGNIGYVGAGRIPVRKTGKGAFPVNGGDAQFGWRGYVPAQEMPFSLNPARGYIVSANNKVVDDTYPHFLTDDWAPPARARRIEQMLQAHIAAGKRMSIDDMQRMQSDLLNLEATQLLPLLAATKPSGARQAEALRYLASWNGEMRLDSQAAAIYSVWMPHLRRAVFGAALQDHWSKNGADPALDSVIRNAPLDALDQALRGGGPEWCGAPGPAACEKALQRSLDLALLELSKVGGSDMSQWKWGDLHGIHFRHLPFGDVKLLGPLFSRRAASGGAPATVNATSSTRQASGRYVQTFGAAFRQVVRLGDGAQVYINSTGQSGHPLSDHFDDMVAPYAEGRYFRFETPGSVAFPATLTLAAPR